MPIRPRRRLLIAAGLLGVVAALLWLPPGTPEAPPGDATRAFAWRQDEVWEALEAEFAALRERPCTELAARTGELEVALDGRLGALEERAVAPDDPVLRGLEDDVFHLAARVAVCPADLDGFLARTARLRTLVKRQSRAWDAGDPTARVTLYRLLYGTRAAVEEVLLQLPPGTAPPLVLGVDEPSATPSVVVQGVRVHSGDLLISRGGAPVSALIARGSDLPGNFSHAALAHVAEDGTSRVVEALIERGTVPITAEEYLAATKLRIMVLRLAADHPALAADPLLPHRAASHALAEGLQIRVPYDFAMDLSESGRRFCSEVAWLPYAGLGVDLWRFRSTMSSPGLRRWLASLGVRHFEGLAPSDLESDPQVVVVAEWRDPEALWQDHLDNAVVDAMLERAEAGADLPYSRAALPLARAAAGWSRLLNRFGRIGPVPEGMGVGAALRSRRFSADHHAARERLEAAAAAFQAEHGYRPPYWELVRLARAAVGPDG